MSTDPVTMRKLPEPWRSFLSELDQQFPTQVSLHCTGGFVLTAYYRVPRRTNDIDCLAILPREASSQLETLAGPSSKLARRHRVHLQRVGIVDLPDEYEQRLLEMKLGLRNLRVLIVDAYDLVLSKLTANRSIDRDDVRTLAGQEKLKFSLLEARFTTEMKPWLPNLARHELTLQLWREYFLP